MEEFKGYVEHIIYRNEENTYTVFEVQCEDGLVTCTGFPPAISEGESCIVSGEKVQHAVYGEQFKVDTYRVIPPENSQAMLRYLASGAVKGIGQALAARIVKKFGDDTLRVMDEEPERLAEIKGISERKAREIAAYMAEKRELRDAMLFLQQYGVTNRVALKIWKTYGARMYDVLRQNPYQLARHRLRDGGRDRGESRDQHSVRVPDPQRHPLHSVHDSVRGQQLPAQRDPAEQGGGASQGAGRADRPAA